jgi:hypothetical protein
VAAEWEKKHAEWEKRQKLRQRLRLGTAIVLVAIAGAFFVRVYAHNKDGAVKAVNAYLDLIVNGDFSAANRAVGTNDDSYEFLSPALGRTDLRYPDMLDSLNTPMRVVSVTLKSGEEGRADRLSLVTVRYAVGEQHSTIDLAVRRDDSLLFDSWKVVQPLVVKVVLKQDTARSGLVGIGGNRHMSDETYIVFPGRYTLNPVDDTQLQLSARELTIAHTGSLFSPVQSPLAVEPATALRSTIQQQVGTHVQTCAAAAPTPPDSCPSEMTSADADQVTVTTPPSVAFDETMDIQHTEDGVRISRIAFSGSGTYTAPGGRSKPFTLSGTAVATPDKVTITYR